MLWQTPWRTISRDLCDRNLQHSHRRIATTINLTRTSVPALVREHQPDEEQNRHDSGHWLGEGATRPRDHPWGTGEGARQLSASSTSSNLTNTSSV